MAAGVARAAERGESTWSVWDPAGRRSLAWRDFPFYLARADAVFVGEEHDDPKTHRVEAALLAALHARWGDRTVLAMEMLERDGQPGLDDYLAGKVTEAEFGRKVALWPNYRTDYRPLVEWAKGRRVPVLASNVPRRIARRVSQEGLGVLRDLPVPDRSLAAVSVSAPDDAYWQRFRAVMAQGHGGPNGKPMDAATVRRFYEAQCLKDDTMAETVVRALERGRKVLHINGSFHSDGGLGIPRRVLWSRPLGTRVAVVKIVPVRGDAEKAADAGKYSGEADYIVLVPDRRRPAKKE